MGRCASACRALSGALSFANQQDFCGNLVGSVINCPAPCCGIFIFSDGRNGQAHGNEIYILGGCDMEIISLTDEYREKVERIVDESYSGMKIAVHRELFDLRDLPCLIALSEEQEILGYCYYRFSNNECEIMAIESIVQNIGIGSALINAVTKIADDENCKRVYLQTTNDNCHAFRFYQRRGFTICAVRLNELDYSRKLIPAIPLIGDDNIPALHEIEFEFVIIS